MSKQMNYEVLRPVNMGECILRYGNGSLTTTIPWPELTRGEERPGSSKSIPNYYYLFLPALARGTHVTANVMVTQS